MHRFFSEAKSPNYKLFGCLKSYFSLTVILAKVFNPGMLRDCYRTTNFGDFRSAFS